MKHRLIFFAVMMMAMALPQVARAYSFGATYQGHMLYYNICNGNKLRVTYPTGPTDTPYSGTVVIPSNVNHGGTYYTVTSIGDNAFSDCSGLTSVTIPNSVTSIGNEAFYGCSGLTSITIPNSVTSVGYRAFANCGLDSLTVGSGLSSIGNNAFANNTISYLKYNCPANIPGAINKSRLATVIIGNSVTSIGDSAFFGCTGLTSVTIPNNVTSIGDYAFRNCSGLTSVIFNAKSCISAGSSSSPIFYGCTNLTSITFGNNVRRIPSYLCNGCSGLTSITIPSSVTEIGQSAFYGCNGLTFVTIPSSVTSIGQSAFRVCTGLTSITIPDSVISIGYYVFYGCSGLTSVTIGSGVTSIGNHAFQNCSGLASVIFNADSCISAGSYSNTVFSGCNNLTNITFGNNVRRIPSYLCYGCSGLTSVTIPNSVTSIGEWAFTVCTGLTSITIPDSATSIGDYAFSGCTGLTSVTIPNSVTSIGSYAFNGCGLDSLTVGRGLANIGGSAFSYDTISYLNYNCPANVPGAINSKSRLVTVIIGNSVTSIGERAFNGCSSLTSVTIPSSVTTIGNNAFRSCSGLTSVIFNAESCISAGSFSNPVFNGCSNLTNITFGNNVRRIPSYLCNGCTSLTSITIGSGVTSIGDGAFNGCSGLTSVNYTGNIAQWCNIDFSIASSNPIYYSHSLNINGSPITNLVIPDGVTEIKQYAFCNCRLDSLTVGRGLATIGDNAFYNDTISYLNYNCPANIPGAINKSRLATVIIGDSITTIADQAFQSCTMLTSVTIPNSITSIGSNAFSNCSGLTSVIFNADSCTYAGQSYSNRVFNNCTNIANFTFGSNVKSIPAYLCYGLSGITNITIPEGVTAIGRSAFNTCSGLTSVVIPDAVANIGLYAFEACSGLNTVTIGSGVTDIGKEAFVNCTSLDTVYMMPLTAPSLGTDVFKNNASGRVFIIAGCSYDNYYTTALSNPWYTYRSYLRNPIIDINVNVSSSDATRGTAAVVLGPSSNIVRCDSTVVVLATASYDYHFDHWSNGSTANPDTITLMGDSNVTAYFIGLTVLSDSSVMGSGAHSKIGNHIEKITATANYGYHFDHWSNGSTANPDTIALTGDSTVTAYFERNTYNLAVGVNDATLGTVATPLGTSALYGDYLKVVATPIEHYHIASWNWLGEGILIYRIQKDTVMVEMLSDRILTCNFAIDTHTVAATPSDILRGSVSVNGTEFEYGQPCTVEATAYTGFTFHSWSNGVTANPYTFAVTEDVELTAIFLAPGEETYTVTVSVNDPTMGSATVNGNATATVMSGTEVTLQATANTGYRFVRWNDNDTHAVRTVTVTADATYTAYFEALQGIDEIETSRVKIEVSGLAVKVENPDGETVQIYDIAGRQLATSKLSIFNFQFSTSGVYIVKVAGLPARKIVVVR